MVIASSLEKLKKIINKSGKKGKIGFVPTLGALHLGHLSLVKAAGRDCDFVVVSIFVNPAQFGPGEDFKKYPRNFKNDKALLEAQGVDLLFYPSVKLIYPDNFSTYVEEKQLSRILCAKARPGHFKGVCTIVAKLFNLVQPDIAYFGQKDYQQAQIIKRMVRDLNFPVRIKILPIVRDEDGLALSSRNSYLNPQERKRASCLFSSLKLAKELIRTGERKPFKIKTMMRKMIRSKKNTRIDYLEILEADSLRDLKKIKGQILIALAVYLGETRLIDNLVLNVKS